MKIAAISDDGKTISQHFGMAQHYVVVTVEDGKVTGREMRDKWAHSHGPGEHPAHHGHGAEAEDTHARMASSIADCEVLLARGMGTPAYSSLRRAGIKPLITDIASVDEAVAAYLAGTLVDHTEKLH